MQASKYDRTDLVESTIHPGLDDATESLTEVFEEMQGQLDKEMKRIAELRVIREEDPGKSHCWNSELWRASLNPSRHILHRRYRAGS